MLKNPWWQGDPSERYWLEITDRTDLGSDLWSPQKGDAGRTTSGYECMSYVQPGDVVYHYWKQPGDEPGIVGASRVTGSAFTSTIRWLARGKNATGKTARTVPAWKVPLEGFTNLAQPIFLRDFRSAEVRIRRVFDDLASSHGEPIYFPFRFSGKQKLRANQLYLTKIPKGVVGLFQELSAVEASFAPSKSPEESVPAKGSEAKPESDGLRYQQDPKTRRAIELQAVKQAREYFEAADLRVEVKGKPYDLLLSSKSDSQIIHVEVKGSSQTAVTVELTKNEVRDSRVGEWESILVVVDQIQLDDSLPGLEPGLPGTRPGRMRIWRDWRAEKERLVATQYSYTVPPGGAPGRLSS